MPSKARHSVLGKGLKVSPVAEVFNNKNLFLEKRV